MAGQARAGRRQLKGGALVVVALATLMALVFLVWGKPGGFLSGHITAIAWFENSAGLKVGAPVTVEGVRVGSVRAIRIVPSHGATPVEVEMRVKRDQAQAIRTDSEASLVTVGVMGDVIVDIDSRQAKGPAVRNWGQIPTGETANLQSALATTQGTVEELGRLETNIESMVVALNSEKGTAGLLLQHHEALYRQAVTTLNRASGIVDRVNSGHGSLGETMKNTELQDELRRDTKRVSAAVQPGKPGNRTEAELTALSEDFSESEKNLNELQATIRQGKGMGAVASDPKFRVQVRDTVTQMDSLLAEVKSAQGQVGTLEQEGHGVRVEARGLMTEIRKDPKKVLAIRMRIF